MAIRGVLSSTPSQKERRPASTERRPLGQGVHTAYEDDMVNEKRALILKGLLGTPIARKTERVANGFEAARATIAMMRRTFTTIPPMEVVNAVIGFEGGGKARAEFMWKTFGDRTIDVMKGGSHLLAVLWESAWGAGAGESRVKAATALTQKRAMSICQNTEFLPSVTIDQIGRVLTRHP